MEAHDKSRPPAVAGLFYPSNPAELETAVAALLDSALTRVGERLARLRAQRCFPRALIAPHAGYVYSGPVAATAYAYLTPAAGSVRRVAVFGPAHRFPVRGMALSSADRFEMPGFSLAADRQARELLTGLGATVHDNAHAGEHSIEVHFPFLRAVLGDVAVAAVAVGEASPPVVGSAMEALLEDEDRVVVVSSDLSHYLDYRSAVAVDRATAEAILALRYEEIGYDQACGRNCINGLLWAARRIGLVPELLDLRNSGDTAGSTDSVVGYPAFAFWRSGEAPQAPTQD